MSGRARTLWTFVVTSVALLMVILDNLVVATALPGHPHRARRDARAARVDRQRLHAHVRGAAADRRRARRPLRTTTHVRHRPRDLHRRVGGGGDVDQHRDAHRSRAPSRAPARAIVVPLTLTLLSAAVPAERRGVALGAWGAVGGLAVALGPRRRWRHRRRPQLALDLLDQRAHRPRAAAVRVAPPAESRGPVGQARPARPRARERRPAVALVWGVVDGNPDGWTSPAIVASHRRRHRAARSASSSGRVARAGADAAAALLPQPRVLDGQPVVAVDVLRDVRLDLPADASSCRSSRATRPSRPACGSCPGRIAPIFVAPIAGAMSDRVGGRLLMGIGLTLQAIGLAWLGLVASPDRAVSRR